MLYSEYCQYCNAAKEALRPDLLSGKIMLINVDTNREGRDIARMFGGVPTLIEEDNGEIHELVLEYSEV